MMGRVLYLEAVFVCLILVIEQEQQTDWRVCLSLGKIEL